MDAPHREPIPPDLEIRTEAPDPIDSDDSDLGRPLSTPPAKTPVPPNRLVVLGDSLSQGFKSGAIHETNLAWPALVAGQMGWAAFRCPDFPGPAICPGQPLNIEALIRAMEARASRLPLSFGREMVTLTEVLVQIKEYWEHGPGSENPSNSEPNHNLATWGWDLGDASKKSLAWCQTQVDSGWLGGLRGLKSPIVAHSQERSAARTLWNDKLKPEDTNQVSAAKWLGDQGEGDQPGIETLVVELGANNALGSIISLEVHWSGDGFDDIGEKARRGYNVWQPKHFKQELDELVPLIAEIKAKHVVWCTVPHVTIAPLARGIGDKPSYSRYFSRYTHYWIPDSEFDATFSPCLTGQEARAIDSAIDAYNDQIKAVVIAARSDRPQRDWLLFDMCGLLDRLAYRRYLASPDSRPAWWTKGLGPYELPEPLRMLTPRPDTRYLDGDQWGRTQGGLIALDGVHPTTIGYGVAAYEVMRVMQKAGVDFDGKDVNDPTFVESYWRSVLPADTLIDREPLSLAEDVELVKILNEQFDLIRHLVRQAPV